VHDAIAYAPYALNRLYEQLDHQKLKQSANFYAEIYETDQETQELTQSALSGWPT